MYGKKNKSQRSVEELEEYNTPPKMEGDKTEKHLRFGEKIDGLTIRDTVIIDSRGRRNRAKIINENILYELIFQSQTEKAFVFQKWVFV